MIIIKKLIYLIVFLIPIYIGSFNKTTFFNDDKKGIVVSIDDFSMDLNDYLFGVVSAEMPALFEDEALKAQVVASRSFVLSKNESNISTTKNEQAFKTETELRDIWKDKYEEYSSKIKKLINSTKNEVIFKDNNILKTYYFSMGNGYTEDSKMVFNDVSFKSVESYEDDSINNFVVETMFTKEELEKKLNVEITKDINIKRNNSNRVENINIGDTTFTGIVFRKLLNLRSTDFDIAEEDSKYKITTKGYGHGVGMSQYGANIMAKNGKKYKEILEHFYQTKEIKNFKV